MKTLEAFFREGSQLPPNEKTVISERFQWEGQALEWEIRAVREAELRATGSDDMEQVCALAVVFPDLKDPALLESYQAKDSVQVLQKMLTPAEYLRFEKAVRQLNGFAERKANLKEMAKN